MSVRWAGSGLPVVLCAAATLAAKAEAADYGTSPWAGYDYQPAPAYAGLPRGGRTAPPRAAAMASYAPTRDWWSGLYLGATVGYGFGSVDVDGAVGRFDFDQTGALYGVLGGYNWRRQDVVLGLEGEIRGSRLSGSAVAGGVGVASDLNWQASARGRLGFLVAPALLVYGLGGVTFGNFDFAVTGLGTTSSTSVGGQIGAGAEVKLTEQISLRVDYTYNAFERERLSGAPAASSYDPSFHSVQTGLTFRF